MVKTVFEAYKSARDSLSEKFPETAAFEAKQLLLHCFGMTAEDYLKNKDSAVEETLLKELESVVNKRLGGFPTQYIVGKWEFYGRDFYVEPGVLIPRADTETVIEAFLKLSPEKPAVADLCSGSGCIAITAALEKQCEKVSALEFSPTAYECLERNIKLNNAEVETYLCDVTKEETARRFSELDCILCNPPYLIAEDMENLQTEVKAEPREALFGGDDGLFFYRRITEIWKASLKKNGFLIYEIGINQENDVAAIMINNGFKNITQFRDLAGIIRVVCSQKD